VSADKLQITPETPQPNDKLAQEESQGQYGKIRDTLDDHEKNIGSISTSIKQLAETIGDVKFIQVGILVVAGIGFIGLVITAIIFFSQTTEKFNDEVKLLKRENQTLQIAGLRTEVDSLQSRVTSLSSIPNRRVTPHRTLHRRKRHH
jgi:hypothetical protein